MNLPKYTDWFSLKILKQKLGFFSRKNGVFKNIVMLTMGAGLAHVVTLLAIPVLTRIYSPEDLGVLSVYVALVAILAPTTTLRYVVALPLPRSNRIAFNIMALCFILLLVSLVIYTLLIWLIKSWLLELLNLQALSDFWWLIVFGLFSVSFYELLSMWSIREQSFKLQSITLVQQALLGNTIKIFLGLFVTKSIGLVIGQIFQQGGGVLAFLKGFYPTFKSLLCELNIRRMIFVFSFYSNFPKFRLPSQILVTVSTHTPVLFFSIIYGREEAGQLGLALMAVSLPIVLLATTTGKAFYSEASRIGKNEGGELQKLTMLISRRLFLVALPIALFLAVFGPIIFEVVFGGGWKLAGYYSRYLALCMVFQFVYTVIGHVLTVVNRLGVQLANQIVRVTLVLVAFLTSWVFNIDSLEAIVLYSLLLSLSYIYGIFGVRRELLRASPNNF